MRSQELLKDAVDIHIHVGPDADPNRSRRVNAYQAASQARDAGMKAIVLKSHDYITTPISFNVQPLFPEVKVFGGVSLDHEMGGLNPVIVELAGRINSKIIWMPTFSSKCDRQKRKMEGGITILDDRGAILPVVTEILELIVKYNMTLSTGHLSTEEIFVLIDEAKRVGVKWIVVTHPLSPSFGPTASIEDQQKMIREGVFIEHCFIVTMPTSDRLSPQRIFEAIRTVGAKNCIMSTDFGQAANPTPVEGMRMFIETMMKLGITEEEIVMMARENPARVLGLS